jgi:choline dehydrogenase-like flavoprotein
MTKADYVAARLPKHAGRAAWNAIIGDPPPARPLKVDVTADFAVIGAGFAGLSAARRLHQLQPDARIVILDAGRKGAAGRNSGFMIDLPHDLTGANYAGGPAGEGRSLIALETNGDPVRP